MRKFGLIGFPLTHSFSRNYFTQKFVKEGINNAVYELYELPAIEELPNLIAKVPELKGLNVTIPHKQTVIPLLDEIDEAAARIGAVNTIKITGGKTKGFNTDFIGFRESLRHFLPQDFNSGALILGNGGAAKAVQAALENLQIPFKTVSRKAIPGHFIFEELTAEIIGNYQLIINTTPLGTFPETEVCPGIPYKHLTSQHFLYDLVYNPEETLFMKNGRKKGAKTKNGHEMLVLQAEAAWQIWNS